MKVHEKAQKRWRWALRMEYVRTCTYKSRYDEFPVRDPFFGRRRSKKGVVFRYGILVIANTPPLCDFEKRIIRSQRGRFSEKKREYLSKASDQKIARYEKVKDARGRRNSMWLMDYEKPQIKRNCKSR